MSAEIMDMLGKIRVLNARAAARCSDLADRIKVMRDTLRSKSSKLLSLPLHVSIGKDASNSVSATVVLTKQTGRSWFLHFEEDFVRP
jgi:hypothetical protein